MTHGHPAGKEVGAGPSRADDRRRLWIAVWITGALLVVELAGGILSGSLALLADAGHMLSDIGALAVSLFALWIAARPATPQKTYGYYRLEILSALFNGVVLLALAALVFTAAWMRLGEPPEIRTSLMIWTAALGLLGNLAAIGILYAGARRSLNLRAALAHILGDALSSLGVLLGGAVMAVTGWYRADPILSMGIGVVIVVGAWRILREALDVLLEATPRGLDPDEVAGSILELPGVHQVHDLHIWSITSGMPALSGHVIAAPNPEFRPDDLLNRVKRMLLERYQIEHTTLQIESPEYEELGKVHERG